MSRWFILRTSGGQTLPLAASLRDAGVEAWTPARVLRRYMPAKTPTGKRLFETNAPILPTFVFVRAAADAPDRDAQLIELALIASAELSPHPRFSIFRFVDRHGRRLAPFVGDREIAGLQEEEAAEAARIKAVRDAETWAEAEEIRIAAIKSASARRRAEAARERAERAARAAAERAHQNARRAQQIDIAPGTPVEVAGEQAFIGLVGVMEGIDGHYANVRFGNRSFKIEGWQVMPSLQAPRSIAA